MNSTLSLRHMCTNPRASHRIDVIGCDVCYSRWTRSPDIGRPRMRSEEHTSELQSLMRISYAVFCLKKKKKYTIKHNTQHTRTQEKKYPISRYIIQHM